MTITSSQGKDTTTFARLFTSIAVSTTSTLSLSATSSSQSINPSPGPSETASALSPGITPSSSKMLDKGKLSSGTKAGISLGAICGTTLLVGLGYFFYHNYRKAKELEARLPRLHVDEYKPPGVAVVYGEVDYEPNRDAPPLELDGISKPPQELPV